MQMGLELLKGQGGLQFCRWMMTVAMCCHYVDIMATALLYFCRASQQA